MFSRLLARTLAELSGTPRQPTPIPDPPPPVDDLAATIVRDLGGVALPAITDPVAARRTQGLMAIALHLGARERLGAALDEAEVSDLTAVLGTRPPDLTSGLAKLAGVAATTDDVASLLPYLCRRADRQMAVWAPALGPLADKPFAPIPRP
jgi:hypothetical protein